MPEYDVDHKYEVFINGLDITGLLVGLVWEENAGEIAARAHVTIAFDYTVDKSILDELQLSNVIQILVDSSTVVFTGIVFDWDYTISEPTQVTVVAFSPAIYMTHSKENFLFGSVGLMTVRQALERIARDWNIPHSSDDWNFPDAPIVKFAYKKEKISDVIFDLLEQTRFLNNAEIIVRNNGLALQIIPPGTNSVVYQFHEDNITSLHGRWDMMDLVTQVKIYDGTTNTAASGGLDGDTGQAPAGARIIAGPYVQKYGVMQEVLDSPKAGLANDEGEGTEGGDDDDPVDETEKQALEMLSLRGEPRHVQRVIAPDIPTIRKGDHHRFDIGPMNSAHSGPYTISGVQHDATNGIMTLEIGTIDFKRTRSGKVKVPGIVLANDPPGTGDGTPATTTTPDPASALPPATDPGAP